jgi:uncharacterized membrane protein
MSLHNWTIFLADIDHSSLLATLNATLIVIKRVLALLGSIIILIGSVYATCQFIVKIFTSPSKHQILNLDNVRLDLVRTIILGLEFIIAADVIETTTTPDYYSLGLLAVVVLIRTFLNYSLNKDITNLSQREQEKDNLH